VRSGGLSKFRWYGNEGCDEAICVQSGVAHVAKRRFVFVEQALAYLVSWFL